MWNNTPMSVFFIYTFWCRKWEVDCKIRREIAKPVYDLPHILQARQCFLIEALPAYFFYEYRQ